jgi:DNA polymerase zeta
LQSIKYVDKEEDLLELLVKAVHKYDPDILVGFELQKLSWGFLMRRAIRLKIQDYCCQLSRLPKHKRESFMRILQPRSHRTPFDVPSN